jgi:hypothetical protein
MPIQNSQHIDNTFIGKGIVKFMKTGAGSYRDLGEVPEFEFTMTVDRLDYFSNRSGIRTKARTVVREKSATVRIVMSELTADNLALYMMDDAAAAGSPVASPYTIQIFSASEITGALRFVGQNDVGAKVQLDFFNVSFSPSASFSPISDEWGQLEITGDVLIDDDDVFGWALWNISAEVPSGSPPI